jgi:4-amino-4-deoxy-L-arabinose transferase-like glycosyltransferase
MIASSHDAVVGVDEGDRMTDGRGASVRVIALALVLALLWFGGLGFRKLIKPDEGRYAEIPREMVVSGDWLTPRLNGLKYFEKPPLQYWTTAIAYEAFGLHEWTSRLWTALTGFLGVLLVGYTASRLYDRRTGLFAATVLASSLAYVLLAHFNTLDMGLTFFMTATLCAVLMARDAQAGRGESDAHCGSGTVRRAAASASSRLTSRSWMLVAWASMALAVLSKGPVAVVLSGGALFLYLLAARDWKLLGMLQFVRGLALFVLIAGPWFVAVSRANPEFAHFFFIHEHVERFLTTEHRREGPIWYFVPVVIAGVLPWLTLMPASLMAAWRERSRDGFAPERLLFAYVLVIFVFFSLSGSKLPSYVLPVFPALAILVGRKLATIDRESLQIHLMLIALIAAFAAIAFMVVPLDSSENETAVAHFRIAASISMLLWIIGSVIAIAFAKRAQIARAIIAAGLGAVIGWASLLIGHETLGRGMSTSDLAHDMQPFIRPDTTIYSVGMFEHTLDFYLQRTVTLVAFEDELEFGLAQEPAKGIRNLVEFTKRWDADRAPLAIMADDVFATLSANGLPMRVVARDGRRTVVGKPLTP